MTASEQQHARRRATSPLPYAAVTVTVDRTPGPPSSMARRSSSAYAPSSSSASKITPRVISEPSADTSWMARASADQRGCTNRRRTRLSGSPRVAIGSLRTTRSGVAAIDEALEIATFRAHLIAETPPPIIDVHVGRTERRDSCGVALRHRRDPLFRESIAAFGAGREPTDATRLASASARPSGENSSRRRSRPSAKTPDAQLSFSNEPPSIRPVVRMRKTVARSVAAVTSTILRAVDSAGAKSSDARSANSSRVAAPNRAGRWSTMTASGTKQPRRSSTSPVPYACGPRGNHPEARPLLTAEHDGALVELDVRRSSCSGSKTTTPTRRCSVSSS